MSFLNSIKNNSKQYNFPFDHWEYSNALSEEAIDEIVKADIPDVSKHNLNYDGTRAIDGGAAKYREGRASGGHPRSKNGIPAKGYRTRSKTKASNKFILERRKK